MDFHTFEAVTGAANLTLIVVETMPNGRLVSMGDIRERAQDVINDCADCGDDSVELSFDEAIEAVTTTGYVVAMRDGQAFGAWNRVSGAWWIGSQAGTPAEAISPVQS